VITEIGVILAVFLGLAVLVQLVLSISGYR